MNSKEKSPIEKSPGREIYSKESELKRENVINREVSFLDFAIKVNRFPQDYCDDNREDTFIITYKLHPSFFDIYIYIYIYIYNGTQSVQCH